MAKRYELDQPRRRIMDEHVSDHKPKPRDLRHREINKDDAATEHLDSQRSVSECDHEAGYYGRPDDFQKFIAEHHRSPSTNL